MHPPAHILAKVQELHPWARLGWLSEDAPGAPKDQSDDESNRGHFVLLQLYHKQDADKTYLSLWNDAGPVYGKPYDLLFRIPVQVSLFTKAEVFSGRIIDAIKEMLNPIKQRYDQSALAKGVQARDRIRDLAGEGGQYLWYRKNKKDNANNVARKFEKPQELKRSADDLVDKYCSKYFPTDGKMS